MSISHQVVQELQYLPDALQQEVLELARSLRREAVTTEVVDAADEADPAINPLELEEEAILGHS